MLPDVEQLYRGQRYPNNVHGAQRHRKRKRIRLSQVRLPLRLPLRLLIYRTQPIATAQPLTAGVLLHA